MIVSRGWQAIYISCPKTGTNTLYKALAELGWQRHGQFHERNLPGGTRDFHKIGSVRNPYSRAVSAWWSNIKRPVEQGRQMGNATWVLRSEIRSTEFIDFCRWLLNQNPRRVLQSYRPALYGSQAAWYQGIPIDTWLHTETLDTDLRALPFIPAGVKLGRENATSNVYGDWHDYMTPETVELINRWAEPDFDQFGYEKLA